MCDKKSSLLDCVTSVRARAISSASSDGLDIDSKAPADSLWEEQVALFFIGFGVEFLGAPNM